MAAQGEREPGVVEIDVMVDDPMAQDKSPEQDIVMGELELPPQTNSEPEMGAAAAEAAVYDTSPPLPHQNPPPIAQVHPTWPKYAPCWQRWVPA